MTVQDVFQKHSTGSTENRLNDSVDFEFEWSDQLFPLKEYENNILLYYPNKSGAWNENILIGIMYNWDHNIISRSSQI